MTFKKLIKAAVLIATIVVGCKETIEKEPFSNSVSQPQLLGLNVISSTTFHEGVNFYDSDNHVIYFTRSDKEFKSSTLYSSKFKSEAIWSEPEILPFSGEYYDAGLSFYPNKETAYFTSKRDPLKKGLSKEWNIWKVEKTKGKWGIPEALPHPINSDSLECCLTVNEKGQAFFSSNRDGSWDIYQVDFYQDGFSNLKKLSSEVNSENGEWPGFINSQGNTLAFSSIRESGVGGDDLYITKKNRESWSRPTLLNTVINSVSFEDSPLMTQDGNFLLFSSWKKIEFSDGVSNIYYFPLNKDLGKVESPIK